MLEFHHAKLIQPFLQQNKEVLELVFLHPYSPQLNPIEKYGVGSNEPVSTMFLQIGREIATAVFAFLNEINRTPIKTIDRL